ncbi:MAG: flagellar biosynthesis anti-sigma factor FlgM [Treponema lecithinolyticum]|uniref:flagellar biosynthesis anti-sigma factor FlgM n=1 Tax=Treponema lecithinolyticum TaxID=53418 RepID=UPI00361C1E6F
MVIDRLGGIDPLKDIQSTHKNTAKHNVSAGRDSISISDEAREMAEAYYLSEVAAETPDVRSERVAQVREKIKDPAYLNVQTISSTADKILDSFGL